jgi:hypothetical protein
MASKIKRRIGLFGRQEFSDLAAGYNNLTNALFPEAGNLTLYVNKTYGLDANDGLSADRALKTIQAAINKAPLFPTDNIIINVAEGEYIESLNITNFPRHSKSLSIIGSTWLPVTPATGSGTGTFDASFSGQESSHIAVVTGATWTTNDLRGKFVNVLTGAGAGTKIPIAANTADTLTLTRPADRTTSQGVDLRNQQFEIVTPGATLTREASATYGISVFTNTTGRLSSSTTADTGFNISNFNLNVGTTSTANMIEFGSGAVDINNCAFLGTGLRKIYSTSAAQLRLDSCISIHTTASTHMRLQNQALFISCTNTGLVGGTTGVFGTAEIIFSGVLLNITTTGFSLTNSPIITNQHVYIKTVAIGFLLQDTSSLIILGIGLIKGCTTAAISALTAANSLNVGNNMAVFINAITIDACASAVSINGAHATVELFGCTITNSTGIAVNAGAGKRSSFNLVTTNSTVVMSSNAGGDFSLDGSATTSLATLRADPDKDIADTIRFSRLMES